MGRLIEAIVILIQVWRLVDIPIGEIELGFWTIRMEMRGADFDILKHKAYSSDLRRSTRKQKAVNLEDYTDGSGYEYEDIMIKLRGFLSHIQQLRINYWGMTSTKAQSMSHGLASRCSYADEDQQPTEATGVGRSWVQSMFSRDTTSRTNSFNCVRRWTSDSAL